mmetsp:Transcript_2891/g.6030  ORF Transcript_2891/g.6030 Transcript_2891/m.6030 type:complete len:206 (+) Transcript_2891:1079-1696(+)
MLQLSTATIEQTLVEEHLLVVLIEHCLHPNPEALLPLEHGLLGHDVRGAVVLEATLVEDVCEIGNVVKRVAVGDNRSRIVFHVALIHNLDTTVLREEKGRGTALSNHLVPCTVLPTNCLPLKKHGLFESQLHSLDVDGVAADCNPVPSPPHRAVGRAPRLLQPELLLLRGARRDGRLLEDGTYPGACLHRIVQHLVLSIIAAFAG